MCLLHRLASLLRHPRALLYTPVIGALLVFPSVFTGFCTDDHNFRLIFQGAPGAPELVRPSYEVFSFFKDRGPENRNALIERGVLPWWVGVTFTGAFFRPLSSLSHYMDHMLFAEHAWAMHLHSLGLFFLLLLGIGLLYRRLHGHGWLAALALLLYAVDDALGMNVGWLSGRNTLLGALFAAWALLAHDAWRRSGWRWGVLVGPLLWGAGLASAEAGLAAAGFLAAYTVTVDPAPWHRRALALLPYAPVFLVWAFFYKTHGYGARGSNGYIDPFNDPVLYLKGAALHLPVQLFGEFGIPDSVFFNILPHAGQVIYWLVAVAYLCILAWLLLPVLKVSPLARFWALGMLLALLPAAATLPQDRLLATASIGGAPLIALILELAVNATRDSPRLLLPVANVLVLLHLIVAPIALVITSSATGLIEIANLRANASLPMDAALAEDTLVIVNAPSELMSVAVPLVRSSLRQPVPAHTVLLSVGNDAVTLRREGSDTVLVETAGDMLDTPWANLFRQTSTEPLRDGWQRSLSAYGAEVLTATELGSPRLTRFTFKAGVDSPHIRWVTWTGDHYAPFVLPTPGSEAYLAPRAFLPVKPPGFEIRPAAAVQN